jgi:uncharacterized protein (DUF58 family)
MLSVLSPLFLGLAVLLDVLVLLWAAWDARELRQVVRCAVRRDTPPVWSLGVDNGVDLTLENPTRQDWEVEIFDAFPDTLMARPMSMGGRLPARGTLQGRYHVLPPARGDYQFGDVQVRFRRPYGLMIRLVRYRVPVVVRVYPNVQQIHQHQLLAANNHLALMGLHRRRQADVSQEFDSLREYHPDDDPRHIDWKASARHSDVMIRHYEAERSQVVMLLLDCGRLMGSRLGNLSKLDHAVNTCLMLTWLGGRSGDRVGLLAFDQEVVRYLPPGHGKQQASQVAQFLYRLEPQRRETDFRTAFLHLNAMWKRRSLVILFTDLVDPETAESLIRYVPLLVPKHKMLCVALSDYELDSVLAPVPASPAQMYEQAAARSIKTDRSAALAALKSRGVLSLDASPETLTPSVLNRYVELKRAGW